MTSLISPNDRIFVAGHRGMAGSAICRALKGAGYLQLLTAGRGDLDLLDAEELSVICRCAVFVGGFDLDAAVAVNPGIDELDLVETLDGLVRKSLVTAQFGRSTRYSMPKGGGQPPSA